jgi:NAD(P)-dependent dehydrogenase (short-subunit alcohol dehydrogenase family)
MWWRFWSDDRQEKGARGVAKALVTGAGKRLGRAMALYLAGRGYDVAVHYAGSQDAADAVVSEIRGLGRQATALRADLLDEAQTAALIPAAAAALGGPLTCLINNASIFEYDTIRSATRTSWDRHIESNLRAPFVLSQVFAAQAPAAETDEMGEPRARALIVNMIDQRVRKLTPEFSSYTIAKMGLWALTRTAAQGLAPDVRVNAIGPGPTLIGARQSETHFARQRQNTVLGRGANPGDITAALGFLLDAPAVTGQLICVDGGQHLAWQTPDILGLEQP